MNHSKAPHYQLQNARAGSAEAGSAHGHPLPRAAVAFPSNPSTQSLRQAYVKGQQTSQPIPEAPLNTLSPGPIKLGLPESFRGPLTISVLGPLERGGVGAHVLLSWEVQRHAVLLEETDNRQVYFIGGLQDDSSSSTLNSGEGTASEEAGTGEGEGELGEGLEGQGGCRYADGPHTLSHIPTRTLSQAELDPQFVSQRAVQRPTMKMDEDDVTLTPKRRRRASESAVKSLRRGTSSATPNTSLTKVQRKPVPQAFDPSEFDINAGKGPLQGLNATQGFANMNGQSPMAMRVDSKVDKADKSISTSASTSAPTIVGVRSDVGHEVEEEGLWSNSNSVEGCGGYYGSGQAANVDINMNGNGAVNGNGMKKKGRGCMMSMRGRSPAWRGDRVDLVLGRGKVEIRYTGE